MPQISAPLRSVADDVVSIVEARNLKYGNSNIANAPGGPLNGLRVRLYDKLARLNNHVDGKAKADFADDSLRDCFVDVAGYALIGLLVLDGVWPGVTREAPSTEKTLPVSEFPGITGIYRPDRVGAAIQNDNVVVTLPPNVTPAPCRCGVCHEMNPHTERKAA